MYSLVYECRALLGQHGVEEEYCSPVKPIRKTFFVYLLLCVSSCPLSPREHLSGT